MSNLKAHNCKEILTERLLWRGCEREDISVAQSIYNGEDIDGIYGLDEAGLLDDFWKFLEKVKAIELLRNIQGEGIRRVLVPFFQFVLLYMLKVLFGIQSMHALPCLLFTNVAAMSLVGFNAHQIKNGVCKRGLDKRKNRQDKIGPICDDALTRNILKVSLNTLVSFFNGVVSCLAVLGIFPKQIWISIDGTDIVTTKKYQGCGRVLRKKRIKDKNNRWQTIETVVYGFKLIVAFYGALKIPLAAKVVEIQEYEGNYLFEVLVQAQKNLASGGVCIVGVVIDRGYLDGKDLWEIKERGIHFVIPAKSGMDIKEDAKAIASTSAGSHCWEAVRKEKVTKGTGKKSHQIELETRLVGIVGLTTYSQYGEIDWRRQANKKRGRYHPINAVIVKKWRGKDFGEKGGAVYLTDLAVRNPFIAFDYYDKRSLIENCLFKEAKRPWHINKFPKKTRHAVCVHVFFTLAVMTLVNAYRHWKFQEEKKLAKQQTLELGIEQFRRLIKKESRDQVIVFIGERYGIFHLSEFAVLSGLRVKDLSGGYKNFQEILEHYLISEGPP